MPHLGSYQIAAEDIESRKKTLKEAQDMIKLKRKEAKANLERSTKAQRAISLCNRRVIHMILNKSILFFFFCEPVMNFHVL